MGRKKQRKTQSRRQHKRIRERREMEKCGATTGLPYPIQDSWLSWLGGLGTGVWVMLRGASQEQMEAEIDVTAMLKLNIDLKVSVEDLESQLKRAHKQIAHLQTFAIEASTVEQLKKKNKLLQREIGILGEKTKLLIKEREQETVRAEKAEKSLLLFQHDAQTMRTRSKKRLMKERAAGTKARTALLRAEGTLADIAAKKAGMVNKICDVRTPVASAHRSTSPIAKDVEETGCSPMVVFGQDVATSPPIMHVTDVGVNTVAMVPMVENTPLKSRNLPPRTPASRMLRKKQSVAVLHHSPARSASRSTMRLRSMKEMPTSPSISHALQSLQRLTGSLR